MPIYRKLIIRSFEANKDMASCLEFSEGYHKVLSDQGISNSYINKHTWMQTEGIFGVLAEVDNSIVGGIILFTPVEEKRFPYQEMIRNPKKTKKKDKGLQPEKTGELFALWHLSSVAGWGLSYILLKAGLALSIKLGLKKTLYLAAEYNIRLVDKLGFEQELENGIPVFYIFNETSFNTKIFLYYFSLDELNKARDQKNEISELAISGKSNKLESVLSKKLEIEYHI